jgi:hypothetical protein
MNRDTPARSIRPSAAQTSIKTASVIQTRCAVLITGNTFNAQGMVLIVFVQERVDKNGVHKDGRSWATIYFLGVP